MVRNIIDRWKTATWSAAAARDAAWEARSASSMIGWRLCQLVDKAFQDNVILCDAEVEGLRHRLWFSRVAWGRLSGESVADTAASRKETST